MSAFPDRLARVARCVTVVSKDSKTVIQPLQEGFWRLPRDLMFGANLPEELPKIRSILRNMEYLL
jgi:hypothetical protein